MASADITFWNGNKSHIRRQYEKALITLCLQHAKVRNVAFRVDETDYPQPEDEGNIFALGYDALVTVDGNQKFAGKSLIKIQTPLCKDLLSHRLLIINRKKSDVFTSVTTSAELRLLTAGIPATWADADILRSNSCHVYEHGELHDILNALGNGQCDYVPLGANEINAIFNEFKCAERGLVLDPHHVIHYPLPLVFYVNPARADVAHWLTVGLNSAMQSGAFDKLFNEHFPGTFAKLNIKQRRLHRFSNPYLKSVKFD
ncbi:hypothetical protein QTP81_13615 [Alteromonas sp. ASW11-36]|uniref:Solute-binding protein family 3/N-terminal domain-containing protein n=1 Tax=Alteromonas arenosi TaxID=3055817 RepID=A0ABT7SZM4_9ALTE|nr:hypothetical protein [Alteromonas sp. ASW11-36]MDM7861633.1 hypothetical protein [Alteromonas sp. ASW11-36]